MDQAITDATAAWTRTNVRVPSAAPSSTGSSERPDPMAGRKLPPTPPPWWNGGQEATRSSLVAAQQLRRGSAPAPPRAKSDDDVGQIEEELGIGQHQDIQAELDQLDGG